MRTYPPVIRPLFKNEIRLPSEIDMGKPSYVSALASEYKSVRVPTGVWGISRRLSRYTVADFAAEEIWNFEFVLSQANGRMISIYDLDPYETLRAQPGKSARWLGSFLSWADSPPQYVQERIYMSDFQDRDNPQYSRILILTAAMLIYKQGQS